MHVQEARRVRQLWGEKPCTHPALDRLLQRDVPDGFVCIRCGREFSPQEREALRQDQAGSASE
jgi:hypothetical protein